MPNRSTCLMVSLLGVLVSASSVIVGQDETRLEPRHVAQIKYLAAAVLSPDGKHAAYTVTRPRRPLKDKDGRAWQELYVTDFDNSRPFITGEVSVGSPQWSADGRSIYYLAKRTGDDHTVLYRIPVDGGESVRVLKHPTSISAFDIAPDGTSVAFLAHQEQAKSTKELREKGFDQQIYEEDWKTTHVWINTIDPDATDPGATEPDPDAKASVLELDGSASNVKWSPSGQELMVVLAPTPSIDDSYMRKRVHVVDSESGRIIRSLNNPGKLGQVMWSPDGKRLALISGEDANDPRDGRLMVASVDEQEDLVDLLPGLEAHVTTISWKDDSSIYWLAADGVSSRFGLVNLDGRRQDLIEPGGELVMSGFSRAGSDETIIFQGHAATHPTELFVASDPAQPPRRITELNPWLDQMRFAKQTAIRWQSRDGLELEGVLVYPLNYVEGRRYPTIMYVHGGPESHESNGWLTSYTRPGHVAAARGFAVFYPNYRGSTGRGVAFSKLGQADAAGREFDDLVDGIDHLIELGIADKDAIGVTGGSYGGYASAWCSTFYSERFAASVMFVGISDNVSKVGTTDIPEEMYLVHHRKRLWEDWEYFLERSPIRHVVKNRTPTLIMHGKEDPRVHPSQSLELHRHLKTLGQAAARLVLYEGEGHGNRKAAARLDYNLRMLRWMEHYLQHDGSDPPAMELDYHQALGLPRDQ